MSHLICIGVAAFLVVLLQITHVPQTNAQKLACGCAPRRFRKSAEETIQISVGGRNRTLVKHGDMLLQKEDVAAFEGFRAADPQWKRWTKGNVKYYLNGFSSDVKQKIYNALRNLSQKTQGCVSFTELSSLPSKGSKTPSVEVKPTGGCFSIVGMSDGYWGPQQMTLGPNCYDEGLIQHEFMHALGFFHEQDRPDRAQTIRFNWDNIHTQSCDLYKMCKTCKVFGPYDTESIMHYAGNIAACDWNKPAMIRLDGRKIEYNKVLTQGDINKVRTYYECKGSGPSPVA
jgi:hypothetical protein